MSPENPNGSSPDTSKEKGLTGSQLYASFRRFFGGGSDENIMPDRPWVIDGVMTGNTGGIRVEERIEVDPITGGTEINALVASELRLPRDAAIRVQVTGIRHVSPAGGTLFERLSGVLTSDGQRGKGKRMSNLGFIASTGVEVGTRPQLPEEPPKKRRILGIF